LERLGGEPSDGMRIDTPPCGQELPCVSMAGSIASIYKQTRSKQQSLDVAAAASNRRALSAACACRLDTTSQRLVQTRAQVRNRDMCDDMVHTSELWAPGTTCARKGAREPTPPESVLRWNTEFGEYRTPAPTTHVRAAANITVRPSPVVSGATSTCRTP